MDEKTENAVEKSAKNEKKASFASDVLTLAGGTTFAQILTILAAPVLTRLYGPEDFGVWALYMSITSIISIIACLRYDYSIMLPESEEEAVNLLGLSFLAALAVTGLTIPFIWYFQTWIVDLLNAPQIGTYLWLVPPFVFVNGVFLALNQWNSRTKLFKRLSFARVFSSVSTTTTQITLGIVEKPVTATGLIGGSLAGQSVATFVLGGQIWKDDRHLIKKEPGLEKNIRRCYKAPQTSAHRYLVCPYEHNLLATSGFSPFSFFYSCSCWLLLPRVPPAPITHEFYWRFDLTGILPEGVKSNFRRHPQYSC